MRSMSANENDGIINNSEHCTWFHIKFHLQQQGHTVRLGIFFGVRCEFLMPRCELQSRFTYVGNSATLQKNSVPWKTQALDMDITQTCRLKGSVQTKEKSLASCSASQKDSTKWPMFKGKIHFQLSLNPGPPGMQVCSILPASCSPLACDSIRYMAGYSPFSKPQLNWTLILKGEPGTDPSWGLAHAPYSPGQGTYAPETFSMDGNVAEWTEPGFR